jgi:hypothetical protein
MAKEISIIIRAKNAMASGLSSAGKALRSFGSGILKIGKWFSIAFLGTNASLVAFVAKAISAYSIQEKAERSLAAAIDLHGQSSKKLLPLLQQIASAIQDETGASDESTLAGMAKMRMLGVQTSKLGEAARAVIALTSIDVAEEAAQKMVAMAMQGSYDMLNRYIPALRMTTDATEKAKLANDFFAKGYAQQKDLLNTVSYQWKVLKGRVGDLWEEFGRAIARNEGLMRVLRRAGDAVKVFGQRIRVWVDSEKFKAVATSIEGIIAAIASGGEDRSKALGVVGEVLMASLARGAEVAVEKLKEAAPVIGKLIGAAAKYAWESLTGPRMSDKAKAREQLKSEGQFSNPKWVSLVEDRAKEILQARLIKEYGLEKIKTIEGETAAQARLRIALEAVKKLGAEYAAKEKERSDAAAKKAADEAAKTQENADKKIKDLVKETTAVVGETAKQKSAREKAELQLHKDFLDRIKKEKSAVEELAKSRVQAVLDAAKAAKEEAKSQEKDDKKAAHLEDVLTRKGSRLGKKQQDWLDAYRRIAKAKGTYNEMGKKETATEFDIAKREEALKMIEQTKYLKNISDNIEEVLEYP